jgi:MFS family permease
MLLKFIIASIQRHKRRGEQFMAAVTQQGGFVTLLRKRNFLLIWLAQLISMTMLNASNYALIVLIQEITGSTTLIGVAIVCFSLPAVLFGAPAGVFVDHRNKRRVLFYSNCLRALATFGFVASLLLNRRNLLVIYLITFLISGIGQFFTPAEGSAIPMLVSESELLPALSLFNVTFMLSQALGYILFAPIILSFLNPFTVLGVTLHPVDVLYIIIGVFYLVCAGLIALIPPSNFRERRRPKAENLGAQSLSALRTVWHEMQQGWRFIRRNPALFLPVVQLSFAGVLLLVIGELATPVVTRLFQLPAKSMAVVFAPAGIGLVVGSVLMPRILKRISKSRAVFIGCVSMACTIVLLPLVSLLSTFLGHHGVHIEGLVLGIAPIIMFAAGFEIGFINIPSQTAMQELTPDWIKGRVLALQLMLYSACSIPIILCVGGIADAFGISNVIYILALSILGFGFWSKYYERKPHRWSQQPPPTEAEIEPEKTPQVEPNNVESIQQ